MSTPPQKGAQGGCAHNFLEFWLRDWEKNGRRLKPEESKIGLIPGITEALLIRGIVSLLNSQWRVARAANGSGL